MYFMTYDILSTVTIYPFTDGVNRTRRNYQIFSRISRGKSNCNYFARIQSHVRDIFIGILINILYGIRVVKCSVYTNFSNTRFGIYIYVIRSN